MAGFGRREMILDKAKMAHDWVIKYGKVDSNYNRENTVQLAWDYADAMQAEADKRMSKLPDVFFDAKQNEEWQPKYEVGINYPPDAYVMYKGEKTLAVSINEEWQPDFSNTPKDAIAYKIVDGIVQYLHGTRSSDGTLCGGYLANDGWIKLENRP